jgi:hypothetical protein
MPRKSFPVPFFFFFFWYACYKFASPDLMVWTFQKQLTYIIRSPGVSKISVVSPCIGSCYTFNFVFHVSPSACMDTWTYRTRNKIISFFLLPLFSGRCNFLYYKQLQHLRSGDTETRIRRKDGDKKNDSFLSCKKRKVIILCRTGGPCNLLGPFQPGHVYTIHSSSPILPVYSI